MMVYDIMFGIVGAFILLWICALLISLLCSILQ